MLLGTKRTRSLDKSSRAAASPTVPKSVQLDPPLREYCHVPLPDRPVTAMPDVCAPVSTSVMLLPINEATVRELTVPPSLISAKVGLIGARIGASLREVTVIVALSPAVLNGLSGPSLIASVLPARP